MAAKKYLFIILVICCLSVMLYSAYKIVINVNEYKAGEELYTDLKTDSVNNSNTDYEDVTLDDKFKKLDVDFDKLNEVNSEFIGWLYNSDESIDYPVVQTDDNSYYLNHLFNKEINSSGCIFIDYRNATDFSDKNTIIYGHNMNNGSMFAPLLKFEEEEYFCQHNKLYFLSPKKNYKIEIFSCYSADTDENSWDIDFSSGYEYEKWLNEIISKSLWKSSVLPENDDKIVTLSTCSNDSLDTRFVLHGILYEE